VVGNNTNNRINPKFILPADLKKRTCSHLESIDEKACKLGEQRGTRAERLEGAPASMHPRLVPPPASAVPPGTVVTPRGDSPRRHEATRHGYSPLSFSPFTVFLASNLLAQLGGKIAIQIFPSDSKKACGKLAVRLL
jgi:hypothetical protein